jgi:hypothetical protein
MKKIIAILLMAFFLLGCESTIETKVNVSDLQSKKDKQIQGDLYFEVATCSDFEDSRKLSEFVVEAQKTIPYIFQGAQYIECFEKNFQSYTHFAIPVTITKNSYANVSSVYIASNSDNLLAVGIPANVRQNMQRVQDSSMTMDEMKLNIKIDLLNDTNQNFPYKVISAYVNKSPVIFAESVLRPQQSIRLKLSDVSTDNALQNGLTSVLLY